MGDSASGTGMTCDAGAPKQHRSAILKLSRSLHRIWLVKSSAIFVSLGLVRGLSQFVFVMVMTRILLPADYGLYSNFLYTTTILAPLFFLKSDVPVARYYVANPGGLSEYIGSIVILCSGVTCVSTILLWFFHSAVQRMTGIPGSWQMLIIITCWTYGLFLVVLAVLQIELRAWAMSLSRIVPTMSCEIFAMALVFALGGGWRTAIATYTSVSAFWGITFLVWLRTNGYLRLAFKMPNIRDFLHISLPLIPMTIGFVSVQISVQFLLTRYFGPAEVGIYAAANQFSLGVWLLASSAQQAFLPWLYATLKKNDPESDYKIVSAVGGITAILGFCTVVYVVVFKFIFPLVVGRTFTHGSQLLGQLAWANFFLGVQMAMNCFLYYRRQTATSAISVCLAAASGLALGLWFIPSGGAIAAAYVTEASAALAALFTAAAVLWGFASTFRNGVRGILHRLRGAMILSSR